MSKERIRKAMKELRAKLTLDSAIQMVEEYKAKLDYIQPAVRSTRFMDNSYSKVACEEILKELKTSEDLPFHLTPLEIFESYSDRMKRFACDHVNKEHSFCFIQSAEVAEYFIEQFWFNN